MSARDDRGPPFWRQAERQLPVDGRNDRCLEFDLNGGSKKIRVAVLSASIADEADFVRRVKAFQEDAWIELYDAYFPKMYRYLYVHVGNRDVAEELAAQVFEQACKGIHRYHYRGAPLSSWLY